MLKFNELDYYALPPLPSGWKAPRWLVISLGFFGGRLYFQHEEYDTLREYLGLQDDIRIPKEDTDKGLSNSKPDDDVDGVVDTALERCQSRGFTDKPLAFLQEWLISKRNGQDFAHSPMGFICQGKFLAANHPFFHSFTNNKSMGINGTEVDSI